MKEAQRVEDCGRVAVADVVASANPQKLQVLIRSG